MKKLLFPLLVAATVVMAACSSQGSRSTDPALAAAVKAKLDSKEYSVHFDRAIPNSASVDRALPQSNRLLNLTSDYNIRIAGDSVYSYLPYFGEAYTAIIGRQDGLVFDGPITGYKVSKGKQGAIDIKFSARTFEDRYDYTLTVYPNGSSYLSVNPDRKSSISFDGKLKMDE